MSQQCKFARHSGSRRGSKNFETCAHGHAYKLGLTGRALEILATLGQLVPASRNCKSITGPGIECILYNEVSI